MDNCIVCGKEVHIDDGYVTDGKIFVCRDCSETHTLRTITVYIGNAGVDSNIMYEREAPIEMESGLVDQTTFPSVPKAEYEDEIEADIDSMSLEDFMSKYCDNPYALNMWVEAHADDPDFSSI